MMRAALEATRNVSPSTKVIAVTVLTSLSDEDLPTVGSTPPVADQVLRLASLAQRCGLDGAVCSAHEIARLRSELGPDFLLVVPGIRPTGMAPADQRRVMEPLDACRAGADILVIGRPITGAQGTWIGCPRYRPKPWDFSRLSLVPGFARFPCLRGPYSPAHEYCGENLRPHRS